MVTPLRPDVKGIHMEVLRNKAGMEEARYFAVDKRDRWWKIDRGDYEVYRSFRDIMFMVPQSNDREQALVWSIEVERELDNRTSSRNFAESLAHPEWGSW